MTQHKVGYGTFMAARASEEGPYVEVLDLRSDADLGPSRRVILHLTVAQARALATAILAAASDVEVILGLT